jgi:hypothetical protein
MCSAFAAAGCPLPFDGEVIDMLDVLNVASIEVRRQQVSIGASNFIETKSLNLLLIEADSIQQSQRRWLLTDLTYCVTAVFGTREFFLLRAKVLILHFLAIHSVSRRSGM